MTSSVNDNTAFRLGLVINPVAGLGGPKALKGSDDYQPTAEDEQRSLQRCQRFLSALAPVAENIQLLSWQGAMGGAALDAGDASLSFTSLGDSPERSSPADTQALALALKEQQVDLLVFVGGDGTARDIYSAVGDAQLCLGIPAGVKMHSGVYATTPEAAAEIVQRLVEGGLVDIACQDVRDIDEQAFREGQVKARYFGELLVPRVGGFLQHTKESGREVEALALEDIAAEFTEAYEDDCLYLIGPGTTTRALMEAMQLDNTLLGVDAVYDGELVGSDLAEADILALLEQHEHGQAAIVVTAIGGQGHVFGRGNQQISAKVIRAVGLNNIQVVATKRKITELEGRPLIVDTNDVDLDQQLSGHRPVITGYRDRISYRFSSTGV